MRRLWLLLLLAVVPAAAVIAFVAGGDDTDEADDSSSATTTTAGSDPPGDGTEEPDPSPLDQIPGDPPEVTASALDDMFDPAFPPPLVDPNEIRSGGPPPDGIPPIDDPRFQPASTVDWLEEVEPVLLLDIDGEARAYPIQIMTWHEIVNDTFAVDSAEPLPVTVSYCPLCNSAIAYVRRTDDRIFDFGTSGRLINSSLVMYDRQTESLWSHITGEAIVGTLTGTVLETLPVSTVSWATFRAAHPDGLVLSRDTGFTRDYGRNPYPGYDDVNQDPFLFDGELDGRLPAQTRVAAVRGTTESLAIPLDDLTAAGAVATTLDGAPIVALHAPGTASALDSGTVAGGRDVGAVGVFRPETADGTTVDLEANGDGTFTDAASSSVFDVLGMAVSGPLDGSRLVQVEHLDTFWFAIAAFEPDTRIVTP